MSGDTALESARRPARVATVELIVQLVRELREGAKRRPYPEPFIIGVKAAPIWNSGELTDPVAGTIRVEPCRSPLAARRAIAGFHDLEAATDPDQGDPDQNGVNRNVPSTLVLLCDLHESELGADLLARFVRPKLYGLSPWDAVRQRFGARQLDPSFSQSRYAWMAEVLLEIPVGSLPAGAVVLSAEAALRAVVRSVLGATGVSLERLLVATADRGFAARVKSADPKVVTALCATLGDRLGPAGQLVAGAIAQGRGEQAVPAGLAARTVVGYAAGSRAQALIEQLTGCNSATDSALDAWARAAELAFNEIATSEDPEIRAIAYDIEYAGSGLVGDWQATQRDASDALSVSFEARLDQLAELLEQGLDSGHPMDVDTLRRAVRQVVTHRVANTDPGRPRAHRAQLAARLVSWLRDPISARHGTGAADSGPSSATEPLLTLVEGIAAYVADGAWVDAARRRVGEGDDTPQRFASALQRISETAHQRRATGNKAFAQALSRWTVDGTAGELPPEQMLAVESVLGEVVAPLAKEVPVLFVVLDGCGLGPFVELVDQFPQFGLKEIGRGNTRRVALAALPTVTEASRATLLAGKLGTGGAADEKRELPAHPKIARLPGQPAVLFHHRPDLISGAGQGLPTHVHSSLGADGPRVVAAVVNTIDDELSRGTFNPEYRLENLGPLPSLLRAATAAGRIVIIGADHGHVLGVGLDGKGDVERSGEGGDRWRVADRDPSEDEVLLKGPRVLLGAQRGVLAPWHDDLRYSAKHGGYHGGATPDECVVPVSVFVPAGVETPKGWDLLSVARPAWWDLDIEVATEIVEPTKPTRRTKPKSQPGKGQESLFESEVVAVDSTTDTLGEPNPAVTVPPWIDDVVRSDTFKLQLGAVTRGRPKTEQIRYALGALSRRGGVANYAVIAQATGLSPARVSGFVAMLPRILNVDGFGVVSIDSSAQEIRLDENLLRTQFLGEFTGGGRSGGAGAGGTGSDNRGSGSTGSDNRGPKR